MVFSRKVKSEGEWLVLVTSFVETLEIGKELVASTVKVLKKKNAQADDVIDVNVKNDYIQQSWLSTIKYKFEVSIIRSE